MNTSLVSFNYNGQSINQRQDGFINLTQMCEANGKRLDKFMKALKTQEYIEALARSHQMGVTDVIQGGNPSLQGTWGHPSLAINLARWISAEFAVWCDAHIFNLMATGQTSLDIDPLEEMRLKIELTRLETQKAQTELSLIQFRHSVVTICPEPVQQKVLGYQTVKEIEYRDRIIKDDDIVNDGSTVTKTELCKRYGLLTRNGKPDYKLLNHYLESSGLIHNPDAWQTSAYIQENEQLKREYVKVLDGFYQDRPRNKYIVE
jgi:hypothetical protein